MAVRVDKWLWAVRVFKTRRQATDACTAGRIRINGDLAKPASKVKVGDVVQAARRDRMIIYVAHELLEKRVSAPLAPLRSRTVRRHRRRSRIISISRCSPSATGAAVARRRRTAGRSRSCAANDAGDPAAQPSPNEAASRTQPLARLTSGAQSNALRVSR
ncbi:MAG: S4 domain-containing protein [Acidimicrobiales bacterium]|nr:S4 domain-containing protein [Acidimicrobiales bacterium]